MLRSMCFVPRAPAPSIDVHTSQTSSRISRVCRRLQLCQGLYHSAPQGRRMTWAHTCTYWCTFGGLSGAEFPYAREPRESCRKMSSGFGNNGMQGRCYPLWQDFSAVRVRRSDGVGFSPPRKTGGLTAAAGHPATDARHLRLIVSTCAALVDARILVRSASTVHMRGRKRKTPAKLSAVARGAASAGKLQ
jgi:hypothetical protein